MSQHTKQATTAKSSHRPATENKILEMGDENTKNLMQAADTCSKMSGKLATACSGNLNQWVESAGKSAHVMQNCASEMMACSGRACSIFSDTVKEASACNNMEDAIKLQEKFVQKRLDNYLDTLGHIYTIWFDGWNEVMKPLNEGAATTAKHVQQALAA